jgi:ATP-binding cassette subfamily B protein
MANGNPVKLSLLRRVFGLIREHRLVFVMCVALTILLAVVGPAIPLLVQRAIDFSILQYNLRSLAMYSGIILGMILFQGILLYVQTYYTEWLGQEAIQQFRTRAFNHIIEFKLKIFDRTPVGTLITRTISDVETVAEVFSEGLINISGDLLQIIVILAILFYQNWMLTLVSLSVFPLLLLAAYFFKEAVRSSFQDVRTQVARLNAFLQEHITGMQVVQVFNREQEEMQRFEKINAAHRDANIRSVFAYSVFFPVIEILSSISIGLIVWWGAKDVLPGKISFGFLVAFIQYINLLFRPIRTIADKFNTLQMGMVAAERIFQVMDMDERIPDTGTLTPPVLEGKIDVKNVSFAYEDENYVLRDISFSVPSGQMLAIVGHTGAGKTSITNLVNRLYEYQKGEICIDGRRVEDYSLPWLRKQIAVVLQDVFLFSDTIANNIKLYNESITREQIEQAARLVGADRFIQKLPGGYDYEVQERGSTLSTGQRQLISFIRAVIQNPRILVLDEATSSIDPETEELIQQAQEVLLKDRSSIVIAHRLSTIQNADQIIVMEKGQIVERGKHLELLAQGGLYRKLYELQFSELKV